MISSLYALMSSHPNPVINYFTHLCFYTRRKRVLLLFLLLPTGKSWLVVSVLEVDSGPAVRRDQGQGKTRKSLPFPVFARQQCWWHYSITAILLLITEKVIQLLL